MRGPCNRTWRLQPVLRADGQQQYRFPHSPDGFHSSASDVAYADINEDDRSVIAQNLDTIGPDLAAGKPTDALSLTWLNSISGNSGTLSSINASTFSETGCLGFKTTANTIVGIKLYSGTACRDVTQKFAVTSLNVAEA